MDVLPDEQEVEHTDETLAVQALQLGKDLAVILRLGPEADREQLYRSDVNHDHPPCLTRCLSVGGFRQRSITFAG